MSKKMHHLNIGNDSFEVVDEAGRNKADLLESRFDASLHNLDDVATELWTGEAKVADTLMELSDDVSNFDYIDVYASFFGESQIFTYSTKDIDQIFIRIENLPDEGAATQGLGITEFKVKVAEDTMLILSHTRFHWSFGDGTSFPIIRTAVAGDDTGEIIKVVGRKITTNGEVADIRVGADGTEYETAGDAVRGQIDTIQNTLDDICTEEYEELTGTDQSGKSINYTGTVVDAIDDWHCITYPATAGDKFRINAATVNGGYWYIFTDGTDTIKTSEKASSSGDFINNKFAVAPEGTTNLVITYNTHYITGIVKKITGYSIDAVADLEERIDTLEELTDDIEESVVVSQSNITIHDNVYMFTSGSESSLSTGWQYAEYSIPIGAAVLTVTANAGQSARLWILKDANNAVLGYSSDSSSPSKKTEIIDLASYPTAKKLFVNDKKSGNLKIVYTYTKTAINGEDVYIDGQALPDLLNTAGDHLDDKLYGKVLCCVGDSITYGADMDAEGITDESDITVYNCNSSGDFTQTASGFRKTWGWQIASRHNMVFYNGGVSGSTMQGTDGINGFSLANGRYTKLPENIDYLLIWFGWNDNAYGTLGTIDDMTNDSYYGGYNVVLPYLIDKYTYAKIALIVPFGASAGHRNAIRQLANKWGVAVWDNYQGGTPLYFGKEDSVGVSATIVAANKAKFQANGAHPNYKGHKQLGDMIEEFLKGI